MKTSVRYRSTLARKFIHCLMAGGKRSRAERILDAAIDAVRRKMRGAVTIGEILRAAVESARPLAALHRRRVGNTVYRVPIVVSRQRSVALAIRWVIASARNGRGRTMANRLAKVLLATYRNELDD